MAKSYLMGTALAMLALESEPSDQRVEEIIQASSLTKRPSWR